MKSIFGAIPRLALLAGALSSASPLSSQEPVPAPPRLTGPYLATNGQQIIRWDPYPAAEEHRMSVTPDLGQPMTTASNGTFLGHSWTSPRNNRQGYYRLGITPVSSNALLTATLLNRLAYGPTPDEWERVLTGTNAIGPQAFLEEQLAPELISDDIDQKPPQPTWQYATDSGIITGTNFIIYLSGAGQVRLDDLTLVEGTVPEAGPNLLQNGGFESLSLEPWIATSNYAGSHIDTSTARSGANCLVLSATARGTTSANGFYQPLTNVTRHAVTYTLSYWYLPEENNENRILTVRLSGSRADTDVSIRPFPTAGLLYPALINRTARLADLRAWFLLHAIEGKQQLTEILLQFLENHFVTQHDKTYDYFDRFYDGAVNRDRIATYLEYREISRWRQALLNPQCTFHNLLEISTESPAMIIYLDTVNSRGDRNRIPNENYARELLELFCNGVDNGYNQSDIVELSRVWTGWTVDIKDQASLDDPHAPRSTTLIDTNNFNVRSNLLGVWTFHFNPARHDTAPKTLFPGRSVEARFGPPWAGRSVELSLPAREGTDGIQDGYDVISHLANLPYTQEFISVKLCRLFVHEHFEHGRYNYTDPNRSPEADLIHQCMLAWENGAPQGQIRMVLRTIFNSDLFRSHGASRQKVKTPLEYTVSAIRALRTRLTDGQHTARSDGYALAGAGRTTSTVPLIRMGNMRLFDRAEPDGYSENGVAWISAGSLAERIRFVQSLCLPNGASGHRGSQNGLGNDAGSNSSSDPAALLKLKLPESDWTSDTSVARFFLSLLYPAEGMANLNEYQAAAETFLNTEEDGVTRSLLRDLNPASEAYDTRIRSMAALLMSLQRFHEQ